MGLEWLLSVQEPGGGFHNTTCQERYGPYGTNWPECVFRGKSATDSGMKSATDSDLISAIPM
jgi:hypothetical protein